MKSELQPRKEDRVHSDPLFSRNFEYDKLHQKVQLVGILNVTPDSFFDGGLYCCADRAIAHGHQLRNEGAHWIDIGGESTRPFAHPISQEEELRRVIPVIKALATEMPVSVDTRKAEVAAQAIACGARMINDTSGFTDPKMIDVAAASDVLCCVMHSQGSPATMQQDPQYPHGVVQDVLAFFEQRLAILEKAGIPKSRILLDPGIGFGKTVADCWALLRAIRLFHQFGCPIMLGLSRKSFLQKTLQKKANELLPASLICATVVTMQTPVWLRVHDVWAHQELLTILELLSI